MLKNPPKISVLMPVHNGGVYLKGAVASILEQSHQDIELLLVDDHSTDDAIADLKIDDSRLRILPAEQRGLVPALNQALGAATGDFIARMDSDDISLPDRLETQLQFAHALGERMLIGAQVEMFSDQGQCDGGYLEYGRWINALLTPEDTARAIFIESPLPHPTLFCHRQTLTALGGYRDQGWPEDYDLWLRAWQQGIGIAKPQAVLLRWRDHPQRFSRTDKNYDSRQFIALKAHFLAGFITEPFIIWGAGRGGKRLFDALSLEGLTASAFIDVSEKRIGGTARGKRVLPADAVAHHKAPLLVAVGSRGVRPQIRDFLTRHNRVEGEDYWFTA